jgi:hypothetical protein
LIDREIRFWNGKPVFTLVATCLPILVVELMFDGPPSNQPMSVLLPALALSAAWGALVIWRYVRFEINEFRRLQALGAEEEARKNG